MLDDDLAKYFVKISFNHLRLMVIYYSAKLNRGDVLMD
jgi:hypothetical protein